MDLRQEKNRQKTGDGNCPRPAFRKATPIFEAIRRGIASPAGSTAGKIPLIVLHGGPGCTHDYVDSFKDIAKQGRAVVHYDQLGNGGSTHLRGKGADFWTVQLFLDELGNLLRHLGIASRYHLLGQSWGGMLGAEHAVTRPAGLRSLVIANSPASMDLWVKEANRLRAALQPRGGRRQVACHLPLVGGAEAAASKR